MIKPTFRRHPEGFVMYHAAKDYQSPHSVLVRIETGKKEGQLLTFPYKQWIKFPIDKSFK